MKLNKQEKLTLVKIKRMLKTLSNIDRMSLMSACTIPLERVELELMRTKYFLCHKGEQYRIGKLK